MWPAAPAKPAIKLRKPHRAIIRFMTYRDFGLCRHTGQFGSRTVFMMRGGPASQSEGQPNRRMAKALALPDRIIRAAVCGAAVQPLDGLDPAHRHTTRPLSTSIQSLITAPNEKRRKALFHCSNTYPVCHHRQPWSRITHPIDQHVQTEPHHVNKVPIPGGTFKTKMALSGEMAFANAGSQTAASACPRTHGSRGIRSACRT